MSIIPNTSVNSSDYIVDVPFLNALEKSSICNCIKDAVIKKIQAIPALDKLRLNPELTL